VVRVASYCFLEHFPYRQRHAIWRLQGLRPYLRSDHDGKPRERNRCERQGLASAKVYYPFPKMNP